MGHRPIRAALGAAAVLVVLAGAACDEEDPPPTPTEESSSPTPSPTPTPEPVYQVAPDCGAMPGNDDLVIMVSAGDVDCDEATEVITEFLQTGEDDGDDLPGVQIGDYHCGTADGPGNTTIYDTLVSCTAEDGRQLVLWPADSPVPAGEWTSAGQYSATINEASSYDYVFTSRSGDWVCGILVTEPDGGPATVGCHGQLPADAEADGPIEGEANTIEVTRGEPAGYYSYNEPVFRTIDEPQELAYGEVIAMHGVGCAIVEKPTETVVCLNGDNGFVVNADEGELF